MCERPQERRTYALEMTLIKKQRMIVMKLSGEIDHHSAKMIRSTLETEIRRSGAINAALDLKEVTFMDSSGIGVIIGRYKTVSALGGSLIIYNASNQIKRLLYMSGIQKIAVICDSLQEGIKLINGRHTVD